MMPLISSPAITAPPTAVIPRTPPDDDHRETAGGNAAHARSRQRPRVRQRARRASVRTRTSRARRRQRRSCRRARRRRGRIRATPARRTLASRRRARRTATPLTRASESPSRARRSSGRAAPPEAITDAPATLIPVIAPRDMTASAATVDTRECCCPPRPRDRRRVTPPIGPVRDHGERPPSADTR